MNKRARLARRILREHRRGIFMHSTCEFKLRGGVEVYGFWACPHCNTPARPNLFEQNRGIPVAYR